MDLLGAREKNGYKNARVWASNVCNCIKKLTLISENAIEAVSAAWWNTGSTSFDVKLMHLWADPRMGSSGYQCP